MLLELYEAYSQSHRYYHTLTHIARMFEVARQQGITLSEAQVIAIWFHDVVYDIPSNEISNEKRSAQVAENYLQRIGRAELATTVATIIRDTDDHLATIEESKVVIDLDIWDLGTDRYWDIRAKLQLEFEPVYGLEGFREGRIKWLKKMLARDSIFLTPMAAIHEKVARHNLQTELDKLGS